MGGNSVCVLYAKIVSEVKINNTSSLQKWFTSSMELDVTFMHIFSRSNWFQNLNLGYFFSLCLNCPVSLSIWYVCMPTTAKKKEKSSTN